MDTDYPALDAGKNCVYEIIPLRSSRQGGGQISEPPRDGAALHCVITLVLFFARFLTSSLARESGFHMLFLAGLQVEGVAFDLLDNVFLLHLALEAAQSVLEGFSLLKSTLRQTDTPPNSSGWTE